MLLKQIILLVHRAEGKYPKGVLNDFWPFLKYSQTHKLSDLIRDGEPWKEIRVKLQADILSPQAAASYLPFLNEISGHASQVFQSTAHIPHEFTARFFVLLYIFLVSLL